MIIRAGTGFDNIDLNGAQKRNIIVCNTPEANAISAYEHTMSFIFALLKQHKTNEKNLLSGKWKKSEKPSVNPSVMRRIRISFSTCTSTGLHFPMKKP